MKGGNRRLWLELLGGNRARFLGAALAAALGVWVGFITPMLLTETIDAIIGENPLHAPGFIVNLFERLGGRDFFAQRLWIVALLMVLLYLVNAVCRYCRSRWSAEASENIALSLRERLYRHLQHLPYEYHVKAETGDLIQRSTSDVETVRRFLAIQLLEILHAALMIGISVFLLLGRNVQLTLVSLASTPVLFLASYFYSRRIMRQFRVSEAAEGKMSTTLQENLTGVRVVRAFGRQQFEVEKFDGASADFRDKAMRLYQSMAIFWTSGDALALGQIAVTLVVGIRMATAGTITIGTLLLFITYVQMLLHPVRQLGRLLADGGRAIVAMDRIGDVLRQPPDADAPDSLRPELSGDIAFEDVSFGYREGQRVLSHLSFTIRRGETLAILGATGSGKSTLVHLLQRLYEPSEGRITIGGTDLRRIEKKWLRAHVGLVLQEPFLYSKTIRENLAIVRPDAPFEEVRHAAGIARAEGFIQEMEQGYDTVVGERGVTLSGGQKQRIAIGRTLLKDNRVLIFDDSLSAVDTQTDAAIRHNLARERQGATTIIISHRILTLAEADQIIVLDQGRVVQQGTHMELISQPGPYQRIHHIQNALEDELAAELEGGDSHAGL